MKESQNITFKVIGYIRTPFKEKTGIPIQSSISKALGTVNVLPQYSEGLSDLEDFSHIYLIYHFHKANEYKLKVKPFLDDEERGIFATRAPLRPNPIGISIVRLISIDIQENKIELQGVDMLDQTPVLDIKPYIPRFDNFEARTGWISKVNSETMRNRISDDRF